VVSNKRQKNRHEINRAEQTDPQYELSTQPIVKLLSAKASRLTTGRGALSVRLIKPIELAKLRANRVNMKPEIQPWVGACLRAISSAARPIAKRVNDGMSSARHSLKRIDALGNRIPARTAEIIPGATLIKNSQCQE
jgi:hypothetical protein